jgi:hypothetical protein
MSAKFGYLIRRLNGFLVFLITFGRFFSSLQVNSLIVASKRSGLLSITLFLLHSS